MKKRKKDNLEERVTELEREIAFMKWLFDKHIYKQDEPYWYYTDVIPKPDPITGWRITS